MCSGRCTRRGTSQPKVERKSGITQERKDSLVHGGCYTVLTADKEQVANLLERKKLQTRAERGLEENVNKEDVGWTYDSSCSLLYGG